ncbi:hypothetical protein KC19_2G189600 [Ceratodon purpureus]|uniref:Uncharacterized protein n=1 Tax=Ceratodon purpureus TaxID=3225 RepID=A0A8T0IX46_CERPU|nr:hypothetical protein KC19_2G189600 [Ceratodon purpureus]
MTTNLLPFSIKLTAITANWGQMVTDLLGCVMSSEAMAPTCLNLLPKFGRPGPGRDEDGCVYVLVFVAMRIGSRRRVRERVSGSNVRVCGPRWYLGGNLQRF